MDLFDGCLDSSKFQSLAAAAARVTATVNFELLRRIVFQDQDTVEPFQSLSAAAALFNKNAEDVSEAGSFAEPIGFRSSTATPMSTLSLSTSGEANRLAACSHDSPIATDVRLYTDHADDHQPEGDLAVSQESLASARNLRRKTIFAERNNTMLGALGRPASACRVVISDDYHVAVKRRTAMADNKAAIQKAASSNVAPPVVFENFQFCFAVAVPQRTTFPSTNTRIFSDRHRAFFRRLAEIANYAEGQFVDPGAANGSPSVEEKVAQEHMLGSVNVASFEGEDPLGNCEWFPSGFHCAPEELVACEEQVRHMSGHIGHQWAFHMVSENPEFCAEAWAQEDLLQHVSSIITCSTATLLTCIAEGNQGVFCTPQDPRHLGSCLGCRASFGSCGRAPEAGT